MNIAYTMAKGRGDTDLLLYRVAERLESLGYRTAGTVQINTEREDECLCDMDVKVLPDGPVIRISQSLGAGAKGCRLDPAALESAVGFADAQLAKGADVLIINKFGKHEAEGRGFRDTIATAMMNDIPVLVGANHLNLDAFNTFTDASALALEPDEDIIFNWLQMQLADTAMVA